MAYSSQVLTFICHRIISYISKGRNITWQDQTNMSKVSKHQGKDKQASIFMFINQNKIIFKSMHVHVNVLLTLLTSLHHNTYASMHVHIHMHAHSRQANQIEAYCVNKTRKQKQKMLGLGFLGTSMCVHT